MDSSYTYEYNNFINNVNVVSNLCEDWKLIANLKKGDVLYEDGKGALISYPGHGVIHSTKEYLSSFIWAPNALHGPEINSFKLLEKKIAQTMRAVAALDGGIHVLENGIHGTELKAKDVFSAFKNLKNLQENVATANKGLLNFIQTYEGRTHSFSAEKEDDKVDDHLMEIKGLVDSQILDRIDPLKKFIKNSETMKPLYEDGLLKDIFNEESRSSSARVAEFQTLEVYENSLGQRLEDQLYEAQLKEAISTSFINPNAMEKILKSQEKTSYPAFDNPNEEIRKLFKGIGCDISLKEVYGSDLGMPADFMIDFFRTRGCYINDKTIYLRTAFQKIPQEDEYEEERLDFEKKVLKSFVQECSQGISEDKKELFAQKIARLMTQASFGDLFNKVRCYAHHLESPFPDTPIKNLEMRWDVKIDEKVVSLYCKKGFVEVDEDANPVKSFIVKRVITIPTEELLADSEELPGLNVEDFFSHDLHTQEAVHLFMDYL